MTSPSTAPARLPSTPRVISTPGDAMQSGVHSDLRTSSAHKRQVSPALELKHESGGRGTSYRHPKAFKTVKIKAFTK